jgi:hypothetical protein
LSRKEPRKKLNLNRRIPQDSVWILQQLSSNALTLAGFSFTSLVFMVGFLGSSTPAGVKSGLLMCTITFAIGGEAARTSYTVAEYVISEFLYLLSLGVLFIVFITFTYSSLQNWGVLPIFMAIAGLIYVLWRAYVDLRMLGRA